MPLGCQIYLVSKWTTHSTNFSGHFHDVKNINLIFLLYFARPTYSQKHIGQNSRDSFMIKHIIVGLKMFEALMRSLRIFIKIQSKNQSILIPGYKVMMKIFKMLWSSSLINQVLEQPVWMIWRTFQSSSNAKNLNKIISQIIMP